MFKPLVVVLSCLASGLLVFPAQAQWGTLKGKIVLDGDVPEAKLLVTKGDANAKDAAVCSAQDVPDESLAIDKDSKGIANVAVWLVKKPAKIHPDLAKPKEAVIDFDQVGCKFIPHVLVVQAGQTVKLLNGDAVAHNTAYMPVKGPAFNPVSPPNDRAGTLQVIKTAERLPVEVRCSIHTWMKSWWVVVDHPYATVSDKDGNFEIQNLPAGDQEFRIWHENVGHLVKDAKDPKKAPVFTIKSGETTEVPVVKVKYDALTGKR